jgi:peptidoglycan/LPS O-acetylase OafA/YrhL
MKKLYKLEALRGFCAIYVLMHHTIGTLNFAGINVGMAFRFGQEAVIIFFVLSGFVINISFSNDPDKTFSRFFIKRFLRIYIPLLIVLTLSYALASLMRREFVSPQLHDLILNLLMLQDLGQLKPNVIVEPYFGNSPLWSLSYEWWFYVLFYFVSRFVRSSTVQNTMIFAIAIVAAASYVFFPHFLTRLLMYLPIWWAGVELSRQYLRTGSINFRDSACLIGTLICIVCILSLQVRFYALNGGKVSLGIHPILELRHMVFSLGSLILILCWTKLGLVGFDVLFKPFLIFAPLTYAIYISHYVFMLNLDVIGLVGSPVLRWGIYFASILAFSVWLEVWTYPRLRDKMLSWTSRGTKASM